MAEPQRIVIIGSGLAGAAAAEALRERGYTGDLVVFGREEHQPYELPALSKQLLLGDADEPNRVHQPGFYDSHQVELRLGVEIVDVDGHAVEDSSGAAHSYDRLILAIGSTPRRLPVPGGELPGLRTLRTVEDSLALRREPADGAEVVIVGAGWTASATTVSGSPTAVR